MNIKIYREGTPISADDFLNLENKIQKKIPDQLKVFLLQHNGGQPYPSAFKIQWKDQDWSGGYQTGSFGYFFPSIAPSIAKMNLKIFIKNLKLLATEFQLTPWRLPIPQEAI